MLRLSSSIFQPQSITFWSQNMQQWTSKQLGCRIGYYSYENPGIFSLPQNWNLELFCSRIKKVTAAPPWFLQRNNKHPSLYFHCRLWRKSRSFELSHILEKQQVNSSHGHQVIVNANPLASISMSPLVNSQQKFSHDVQYLTGMICSWSNSNAQQQRQHCDGLEELSSLRQTLVVCLWPKIIDCGSVVVMTGGKLQQTVGLQPKGAELAQNRGQICLGLKMVLSRVV